MVASSRFAAIASVFAVGTSAAAIHRRFDFQPNENAYWLAHDYKWGCSPGGCSANFNLVGKEGYAGGAPGFDVVCSPIYVQRSWVECLTQDGRPLSETSKVYAVWQEGPDNELHYLNAAHVFYNEDEGNWYDAQSAAQIVPGQDIAFKFLVDTVVNAEGGIKPAASLTTVVEQVETPVAEVKTAPQTVPDDSTQPEDSSQPEPTAATVEESAPTDTQESNGDSAATSEVSSESTTQSLPEPVPPAGEIIPGLDTTSDPIPETQPLSSTKSTGSGDNAPADSNPADGTASTAEPAPDSQPTETPTPEAEPSPTGEAPEAVSPEAEPTPTAEAPEAVSPDAEPSAAVEPTETAAPDAEPSPVVESTVAAVTPEAEPSPVSKSESESEPEPEPEPTASAAPETMQEPDATEAEEPLPTPTGDDSEEVPPVDDSNFLVLAQPLAVPKTAESATPSIEVLAQPILETKPTKTALPSFEVMAQPLRTGSPNIPKVPEGGDGA
ncbi:Envelopment polyprotein [Colletotrichum trifolii]|uniref:Envelopment polyprotein n=1 Tax=Colletotrichum trifolii TaxID=5466 RepID=A0A4R8RU76_COLTR|nr:Envelopment polyprotein [Colletotrichum trifolii]